MSLCNQDDSGLLTLLPAPLRHCDVSVMFLMAFAFPLGMAQFTCSCPVRLGNTWCPVSSPDAHACPSFPELHTVCPSPPVYSALLFLSRPQPCSCFKHRAFMDHQRPLVCASLCRLLFHEMYLSTALPISNLRVIFCFIESPIFIICNRNDLWSQVGSVVFGCLWLL